MSLPVTVIEYLNENARTQGIAPPASHDDLFKAGVLDSFTLVDFVTVLEEQCGIKIPDGDVPAENSNTLEAIERYVAARGGRRRMSAFITGSGTSLPPRVVTNEELGAQLGLSPEQIFKSAGIRRRVCTGQPRH